MATGHKMFKHTLKLLQYLQHFVDTKYYSVDCDQSVNINLSTVDNCMN